MKTTRAYEEVAEFIASMNPEDVITFKPSESTRQRVWDLIAREKDHGLSSDERSELDHYLQLEHIMNLARARAKKRMRSA